MRHLTDRKRAAGLGSARSGVAHFWAMKVSSVALLVLAPLFVYCFAPMLGRPHGEVVTLLSRPFPAIVIALTLVVGFRHFSDGCRTMIEDYVHGTPGQYAVIAVTCVSHAAMAAGLFAIARIAL